MMYSTFYTLFSKALSASQRFQIMQQIIESIYNTFVPGLYICTEYNSGTGINL